MAKEKTTWNQRLQTLRKQTGLSQRAFAWEYLQIDHSMYNRYERFGQSPGLDVFIGICEGLENALEDRQDSRDIALELLFGTAAAR